MNDNELKKRLDSRLDKIRHRRDSVPEEFYTSLHEKLVKESGLSENSQRPLRGWFLKQIAFAAAFIAVFAIGVITGGKIMNKNNAIHRITNTLVTTRAEIVKGEQATVKLIYNSEKDITNVVFSVRLDDGIKFVSEDDEIACADSISWEGSLIKGRNEIPFVVEALDSGKMKIKATAEYNGVTHDHEIIVVVSDKNSIGEDSHV